MKTLPAVVVIALLATGCATETNWYLNGQTVEAFNYYSLECQRRVDFAYAQADHSTGNAAYSVGQAGSAEGAGALLGLLMLGQSGKDAMLEQCLNAYGFTKAP